MKTTEDTHVPHALGTIGAHHWRTDMASALSPNALSDSQRKLLFGTCFVALIATSFGFMVRIALLNDVWKPQFNLSDTQVGEIFGAGLWPFAISIVSS